MYNWRIKLTDADAWLSTVEFQFDEGHNLLMAPYNFTS